VAIKYLTQSTWSHAALCIGHAVDPVEMGEDARVIVEADIWKGIRLMPLSIFYERHTPFAAPLASRKQTLTSSLITRFRVKAINMTSKTFSILPDT